ncbi:MAG: hypothetical protein M1829_000489 [Trizodia sp. TS-e1964]|nr:MAG: hypothetical protein M1829_000489 [Trizodia sp. TS-e1964]
MDEHFGPSAEEDEDDTLAHHLTDHDHPHQHNQPQSLTTDYPHTIYRHRSLPDSALGPELLPAHMGASTNLRVHGGDSINTSQFTQQQQYPELGRSTLYPPTPSDQASATSIHFPGRPHDPPKQLQTAYRPNDRALPPREVTSETLTDAYIAFILYCNPSVSLSTDTAELRRIFGVLPKSDGKIFDPYLLLQLIKKLDKRELKTWTQLAIELGVEPPVVEKNQSSQKIQQYAVRLKRWMHAMHVDAFFEYCMGRPHSYYTQIPSPHSPPIEHGRDGVAVEEDLALRALHPESRPKRGRRKTEEKENESDRGSSPAKRPHLDTSISSDLENYGPNQAALFPSSALPSTAHPDDMDRFVDHLDPWTAASAITPSSLGSSSHSQTHTPASALPGGQHFRWRLNSRENTPSTPHPHSAITPSMSDHIDSAFGEPHSAITPSSERKSRSRRRHGPAVSSAWPSSVNPTTGKLRGRPPNNRSMRDGPFSTFPVNPHGREGPAHDMGSNALPTPISTRSDDQGLKHQFQFPPYTVPDNAANTQQFHAKRSGLHLQVPHREGGVVRLATPTLLVNGQSGQSSPPFSNNGRPAPFLDNASNDPMELSDFPEKQHLMGYSLEDVEKILAAKLLNAELEGSESLSEREAKMLSKKVLREFKSSSGYNTIASQSFLINSISWLGLTFEQECVALQNIKVTKVPNILTSQFAPKTANSQLARGFSPLEDANSSTQPIQTPNEDHYDISWSIQLGSLTGTFVTKVSLTQRDLHKSDSSDQSIQSPLGIRVDATDDENDLDNLSINSGSEEISDMKWKRLYLASRKKALDKEEELRTLRRKVYAAVMY